jgi:hypothetical protein
MSLYNKAGAGGTCLLTGSKRFWLAHYYGENQCYYHKNYRQPSGNAAQQLIQALFLATENSLAAAGNTA